MPFFFFGHSKAKASFLGYSHVFIKLCYSLAPAFPQGNPWCQKRRPRAVDPFLSSINYPQKFSESLSSLLILSPALPDPPSLPQKWLTAVNEIKITFLEDFWKALIISICCIFVVSFHSLISFHLSFSLAHLMWITPSSAYLPPLLVDSFSRSVPPSQGPFRPT